MATNYAIIEESGGQRKVLEGDEILIDLYQAGESNQGDSVTFDKVLVVGPEGGSAKVGAPYVDGASVTAEVVEPVVMGDKIHIYKFRPKKGSQRKTGHRQRYTAVRVTAITG
ncbi:MAG: 50S ribosomal protein L21 [Phycisphaerales bacterium]